MPTRKTRWTFDQAAVWIATGDLWRIGKLLGLPGEVGRINKLPPSHIDKPDYGEDHWGPDRLKAPDNAYWFLVRAVLDATEQSSEDEPPKEVAELPKKLAQAERDLLGAIATKKVLPNPAGEFNAADVQRLWPSGKPRHRPKGWLPVGALDDVSALVHLFLSETREDHLAAFIRTDSGIFDPDSDRLPAYYRIAAHIEPKTRNWETAAKRLNVLRPIVLKRAGRNIRDCARRGTRTADELARMELCLATWRKTGRVPRKRPTTDL